MVFIADLQPLALLFQLLSGNGSKSHSFSAGFFKPKSGRLHKLGHLPELARITTTSLTTHDSTFPAANLADSDSISTQ